MNIFQKHKKILFVIGSLNIGGAERHLSVLLPKLKEQGFEVRLCLLTGEGFFASQLREGGIEISAPHIPEGTSGFLAKILKLFSAVYRLIKIEWGWRPDVVHYFLPEAYVFGGLCAMATPSTVRIMSRRSMNDYQLRKPMLAKIEQQLHKRMNCILCNADRLKEELIMEGVDAEQIQVIYNGLPDIPQTLELKDKENLSRDLGLSKNTVIIGCVANLIPYKGHEVILRSFAALQERLDVEMDLLLIGRDDGLSVVLQEIVQDLGIERSVHMLGQRKDVQNLLQIMDVFVFLPTGNEGLSNAILEAQRCGLPVIASDVGGNSEIINHGECGYIVPPYNIDETVTYLEEIVVSQEKRTRFGSAARTNFLNSFHIDKCVTDYVNLYDSL